MMKMRKRKKIDNEIEDDWEKYDVEVPLTEKKNEETNNNNKTVENANKEQNKNKEEKAQPSININTKLEVKLNKEKVEKNQRKDIGLLLSVFWGTLILEKQKY